MSVNALSRFVVEIHAPGDVKTTNGQSLLKDRREDLHSSYETQFVMSLRACV